MYNLSKLKFKIGDKIRIVDKTRIIRDNPLHEITVIEKIVINAEENIRYVVDDYSYPSDYIDFNYELVPKEPGKLKWKRDVKPYSIRAVFPDKYPDYRYVICATWNSDMQLIFNLGIYPPNYRKYGDDCIIEDYSSLEKAKDAAQKHYNIMYKEEK